MPGIAGPRARRGVVGLRSAARPSPAPGPSSASRGPSSVWPRAACSTRPSSNAARRCSGRCRSSSLRAEAIGDEAEDPRRLLQGGDHVAVDGDRAAVLAPGRVHVRDQLDERAVDEPGVALGEGHGGAVEAQRALGRVVHPVRGRRGRLGGRGEQAARLGPLDHDLGPYVRPPVVHGGLRLEPAGVGPPGGRLGAGELPADAFFAPGVEVHRVRAGLEQGEEGRTEGAPAGKLEVAEGLDRRGMPGEEERVRGGGVHVGPQDVQRLVREAGGDVVVVVGGIVVVVVGIVVVVDGIWVVHHGGAGGEDQEGEEKRGDLHGGLRRVVCPLSSTVGKGSLEGTNRGVPRCVSMPRGAPSTTMRLRLKGCVVDLREGRVERGSETIPLTTLELRLLQHLAERLDEDVSREELLREIWGYHEDIVTRAVDSAVTRLRVKIERDVAAPEHLLTVWNLGYRLQVEQILPEERTESAVPQPPDQFFGRSTELAVLAEAVDGGCRIATLLGPGGIGKTRLARRFAASVGRPAFLCPLASAADELDLVRIVGSALPAGDAGADLEERIRGLGPALLILDNAETLAAAVADKVAWWVARAPEITVLATSRERLGLPGERCVELGPLDHDSGCALFVDRARATGAMLDGDDPDVRLLCERLEGHPLAIELGAALTDVLSPHGLVERLDDSLDLLEEGGDASLASMFRSSWDRLDEAERRALLQFAMFRGGFSVEAAEGTIGAGEQRRVGIDGAPQPKELE